jgi:hypothetical protein
MPVVLNGIAINHISMYLGVFLLHLSDFVIVIIVPDNLGEDCPVFDDLFEFCQIYAGGTLGNRKIANASFCFVISLRFSLFFRCGSKTKS